MSKDMIQVCPECRKEYAVPKEYQWKPDNFPICPNCGHHIDNNEYYNSEIYTESDVCTALYLWWKNKPKYQTPANFINCLKESREHYRFHKEVSDY